MKRDYGVEVIEAARRVATIFDQGCDRCSLDDLELLKENKLMTSRRCTKADAEMLDSMEPGETLYEFNDDGEALCRDLFHKEPSP
jgi:hypothetical protein